MLQHVLKVFLVHHWMLAVVRGLSTISLAITLRTMLGYTIYGMDQFHWIRDVAMAFSTAICLFCITLSVFFLSLVADKLLIDKLVTVREKSNDSRQPEASQI